MTKNEQIYLDYAATTPVDRAVLEEMLPYFSSHFGNANSSHKEGSVAAAAVSNARRIIASELNASKPSDIFFTSGGTEANNWAIKCTHVNEKRKRILVSKIEHASVLESAKQMSSIGYEVDYIPVTNLGVVDISALKSMLDSRVSLVSVMSVNNEIGTIQPINEIADLAHSVGANFHTDAVQSLGGCKLDVTRLGADFVTISAHKIYGAKGIGALYINPKLQIKQLIAGGHQEGALRGGTSNVPLIVGFGAAVKILSANRETEYTAILSKKCRFYDSIMSGIANIVLNGEDTVPHILNISFIGKDRNVVLARLDLSGVSASVGAACTAGTVSPSHTLLSMDLSQERIDSAVRFSFGRMTTDGDIDRAAKIVIKTVSSL